MQQYNVEPYDALVSISNKFGISYLQLIAVYPQINTQDVAAPILLEPPVQLKQIEFSAEDIMDATDMQDWDTVNSRFAALKNIFDELKPIIIENSVSPSLIYKLESLVTELGEAISSQKEYESKNLANHVTLLVSYILDYYKMELPTNIDRLQFLGREIILNAEKGDWNTALDNLDYLNVIWKSLEPKLIGIDEQIIKKFSQTINSLGEFIKNKNSVQTIKQANEILNQVLILEANYGM